MYQLTAPNAICGHVIGRGGSKINSITPDLSDMDRHPLCIRKQQKTILFIANYLINAFPRELFQLIN